MTPRTHASTAFRYIEDIAPPLPPDIYACGPGDVHLGSENRVQALSELMAPLRPELLVFNGDLFDSARLDRLSGEDIAFLDLVGDMRVRGTRVLHIAGNHDRLLADVCRHWPFEHAAWDVREEYVLDHLGTRYLFVHGDRYVKWPKLWHATSRYGGTLSYYLRRLESEKKGLSVQVKRASQLILRMSDDVARGSVARARELHADVAVAGHSHLAVEEVREDLRYVNVGSFVDRQSGFFTIDTKGVLRLHIVTTRKRPQREV